jgi:hypothetical protein
MNAKEKKDLEKKIMQDPKFVKIEQGIVELGQSGLKWKERAINAENELALLKGIGYNSPEYLALQKQKKFLQSKLKEQGNTIHDTRNKMQILVLKYDALKNAIKKCIQIIQPN